MLSLPTEVIDDAAIGAAVRDALALELAARRAEVAEIDGRLLPEVDRLVDFASRGGKQIRPLFLCHGYLAARSSATMVPPSVIRAAAALELIQACALIHDDVIDRSDTRRGRPSVHRAVANRHADAGWAGAADHFGVSVAITLGDLALAWADDMFVAAATGLDRFAATGSTWRAMRTEVLAGQMLDLAIAANPQGDPAAARSDAMAVNRYKTAAYTVERPLQLGAELGGADPETVAALREFGVAVGLAFQLRDDLLGIFGDPEITGKPAGDDLVEGKHTVLLADTRAALGAADRARLDLAVGSALSPVDVAGLRDTIAASGAVGRSEVAIEQLLAQGFAALTGGSSAAAVIGPGARRSLMQLADQAAHRAR